MSVDSRVSGLIYEIDSLDAYDSDDIKQSELSTNRTKCEKLANEMIDKSVSISQQMRNCFLLKQMQEVGPQEALFAILALNKGFASDSALLKHEIAYVMGQMRDTRAIPYLLTILSDTDEEAIVRHEAGEALGAIGDTSVIPVLKKFVQDPCKEVSQTCQLALDGLQWTLNTKKEIGVSSCHSVDPAPAFEVENDGKDGQKSIKSVEELRDIYLNENLSLFERYRAMFSLRDMGTKESCLALCDGFASDNALFKHEIAFVLGQMMNSEAIPSLSKVLADQTEHEMVRHEAAEALGSIASNDALPTISKYVQDNQTVVKESCQVAIDMHQYWNNDEIDNVNDL